MPSIKRSQEQCAIFDNLVFSELRSWKESQQFIELIAAYHEKMISGEMILSAKLRKKFYEEILVFNQYVKHLSKTKQFLVQASMNDDEADAIIDFGDLKTNIQIVVSHIDYHQHMIMQMLKRDGYVNAAGQFQKSNDGKYDFSHIPMDVISQEEKVDRAIEMVETAINKKLVKPYSPGTTLLIAVESSWLLKSDSDWKKFLIRNIQLHQPTNQFDEIFVIGVSADRVEKLVNFALP